MELKKIPFDKAERRPCSVRPRTSVRGRPTMALVHVKCPFCGVETSAYSWSLDEGVMRCKNEDCRASLGWDEAVRDMVPADEEARG